MNIQAKVIEIIYEDVSATGGNGGAITGGDVYSMGINPGTKPTPQSTGDLVLSPVSTSPNQERGVYGIPVRKKFKHNRRGRARQIKSEDGKVTKILDWEGYQKAKMNKITYLKK